MDVAMITRAARHTRKLALFSLILPFAFVVLLTNGVGKFMPGRGAGSGLPIHFCFVYSISYFIVVTQALDELNLLSSETPKGKPMQEPYVIAVILMTFIMGFITDFIGASYGTAFMIMGFTVPDGPLGTTIKELVIFGALVVVEYLGRLIACLLFSSSLKMKKRKAVLLSLILSLQGIVQMFQAIRWNQQKLIDDKTYASTVVGIVVVNAIITPIIKVFYKPVVQDFDYNEPRKGSPVCAYIIHLLAITSKSVPTLAPYKNHLKKFSNPSSSDDIIRAFLNYAEQSQGQVQIEPFTMFSPYKYMHETIFRFGEKMHTPLIIVPFFNSEEAHGADGTLRIFNTNIQAFAKCTVGLLVDRGFRNPVNSTKSFSYNMTVIFLGGADDCEALALATRASRYPNITIMVSRINMKGRLS
ncbi:hypothetical protein F3Y22_tig00112249pilonHSYRG00395 [Hibiscus syriacus]|uniref:Cation/H+ exchanger domain-containing protein n=1 Tax=Hibiscus syriacus TaxID=106335 RepID=A0A6A2X354_HIBSY|nr:hypothetical protein F3Y22_tig00112249pilonHSYRG00395 [Hibiscus syriacus]